MGFLSMKIAHSIILLFVVIAGCSQLRVQQSFITKADDWKMFGGDIGRTNAAHGSTLRLPLTQVWEFETTAGFGGSAGSISDQRLFVSNLRGEVQLIDVTTGAGIGKMDFGTSIVGTPVIKHGVMYLALASSEESLVAYDLQNGKILWSSRLGDIESSPLLIDRHLYCTTTRGELICVGVGNGSREWTFTPREQRAPSSRSSPASDGALVVYATQSGRVYAVDKSNGALKWTSATDGNIVTSPTLSGGTAYVGALDGALYAFDAESGKRLWKRELGGKIFGGQAVDDSCVYVGTTGRTIFCLDKKDGSLRWSFSTPGMINSAPVVTGKIVFTGGLDRMIYALNVSDGSLLWKQEVPGRIKTMPIVWKDYLIVFSEDRSILAFKSEVVP